MNKTIRVQMDADNYKFLSEFAKKERSELSTTVRDLVTRGRILLALEKYRSGNASLGRAAELGGIRVGQMMTILEDFGLESRIEKEDYLYSLQNLSSLQ
jgi:predicted HTH domain antitoxin